MTQLLQLLVLKANQTTSGSEGNNTVDTTVVTPIDANGQLSEQELKEQALRETQTIYFAFDNSTIAGDYEAMLSAHAAYLSKNVEHERNY